MEEATLSIGEVARQAGIATSAIRYYERAGVLPAPERVSGQRRYTPETVRQLAMLDVAQRAGFSLDEIRELLDGAGAGQGSARLRELADRKLPEVNELIVRARAMKEWLELASRCGCATLDDCALFADPTGPTTAAGRP